MPEETTPTTAHPGINCVILWKAESSGHCWIVNATLDAKGDVSICSGDQRREWYAIVKAEQVELLQAALVKGDELLSGQSVLNQLVARFGHREDESGPFEAIKNFLDGHAISWISQSW